MKRGVTVCAGAVSLSVLCVCCLFFSACASSKAVETAAVDISGDWILSSAEYDISLYDGYEGASDFIAGLVNSGKSTGISFSADKTGEDDAFVVYGYSGVNSYNGTVAFNGGPLLENPPAVTLVAGPPQAERFERVFLQMLAKVENASISADDATLTLSDAEGANKLVFQRFTLAGTSWCLSAYNTGNAVVSLPTSVDIPTVVFGEGGLLSGSTGANTIKGDFTADSKTRALSFGTLGVSRMAAPTAERAEMERRFLSLLEQTAFYRVSGSSLTLCSSDGTNLLLFYMM